MNTTKYDYRRLGEHIFRIRLDRMDDDFGVRVRYEIQEPADIPRHWWEKLKQFFTVACYDFGYWSPFFCNNSLEDHITQAMETVVHGWEIQDAAKKEWEAL